MDAGRLAEELTCPLTRGLLSDPVSLPCCGKACSREALRTALAHNPVCPLCRASVSSEAADQAPTNRVAQAILDSLASGGASSVPIAIGDGTEGSPPDKAEVPKLSASYCVLPVPKRKNNQNVNQIARLQLRVTNASRVGLRRVLCVLVVDQSGSMSGSPWRQASLAMKHVVAMSRDAHLSHVSLKIVTYNSSASFLDMTGSPEDVNGRINAIRPGYGTSFRSAFTKTMEAMQGATHYLMGRSVTIHSLQNRQDLNGRTGHVGSYDPNTGRAAVHLAGESRPLALLPGNLEVSVSTDPAANSPTTPEQVSVVFMTDGMASESRDRLAEELRGKILAFRQGCKGAGGLGAVAPEVTVHAVGFSSGCDKDLLDQIRRAGTQPGQFRYCEPGDSEDALCGRITGMFEAIGAKGGCDLVLERLLPGLGLPPPSQSAKVGPTIDSPQQAASWEFLGHDGSAMPVDKKGRTVVQLRVKPDGVGTAVAWISCREKEGSEKVLPVSVTCNAKDHQEQAEDRQTALAQAPDWSIAATEDKSFASVDSVRRAWVGVRIHNIAEEAIVLAEAATGRGGPLPPEAVRLWGAFLENRLQAVSTIGSDAHGRVPALLEQLQGLSNWPLKGNQGGSLVSVGRLRDISSASAFSSSRVARVPVSSPAPAVTSQNPPRPAAASGSRPGPAQKAAFGACSPQRLKEASIASAGALGANALQKALLRWTQRPGADQLVRNMLAGLGPEERAAAIAEADPRGNTAIHVAAYYGQYDAMPLLLEASGPCFDIDAQNHHGETPITIAIKRRGYHKTVEALQALGGSIPADRAEDLVQFCISRGFPRTAAFLKQRIRDGVLSATGGQREGELASASELPRLVLDEAMPRVVALSRLTTAIAQGRPVDWVSVVLAALRFQDGDLLKQGLSHVSVDSVDSAWVFTYCFPRQADAPDTPLFLELLERMIDFCPALLDSALPDSGDTLLHRAVAAGSLPHAQFLVERGLLPAAPNAQGSTALHVACEKRYPCIVDFLITAGADINKLNLKGASPLASAVQTGSLRIFETLVAAGADFDAPLAGGSSGDNLLHVAVQNNQTGILALLLDRAEPSLMLESNGRGLSPILVAIERNRNECLNILLDAAVDFTKQKIPGFGSNGTLPSDAQGTKLPVLESKTSPDSPVIPGATALHAAIFFGRNLALSTLLSRGADPNAPDGHGLTPLHRAAQRGDAAAVRALVARGASSAATDNTGRTPVSFGRSHPEVMAALVGPIPAPLRAFASGEVVALDACADIVRRASEVAEEPGMFAAATVLDTPLGDSTQQTALMVAVSHGNATAAGALVDGGASLEQEDVRGLSPVSWAQMVKSQRLFGLLGVSPRPFLPAALRYVEAGKRWGNADAMSIFLGGRRDPIWPFATSSSSLHRRLLLVAEEFGREHSEHSKLGNSPPSLELLKSSLRNGTIDRVAIAPPGSIEQHSLQADCLASKIRAAGDVAGGSSARPAHIFAAYLATLHGPLVPALNTFLNRAPRAPNTVQMADATTLNFSVALNDMLQGLDHVLGNDASESETEAYALAPPGFPRAALSVGAVVTTSGFTSATMDLPVALAALDACHGCIGGEGAFASGKGVFFVISSPCGARKLWSRSFFPEDREVMFPPGTKFSVTGWRNGNLQSLRGAAKLGAKEQEHAKTSDSSLIVELRQF